MSKFQIRVYYEDTDAGGIVYYANYLKFSERARTELLRAVKLEQTDLLKEHSIAFVVRKATLECLRPARLDDLLTIETQITDIGKVSITMQQHIARGKEVLATVAVKLGVIDANMKPTAMPKHVHQAMQKFLK